MLHVKHAQESLVWLQPILKIEGIIDLQHLDKTTHTIAHQISPFVQLTQEPSMGHILLHTSFTHTLTKTTNLSFTSSMLCLSEFIHKVLTIAVHMSVYTQLRSTILLQPPVLPFSELSPLLVSNTNTIQHHLSVKTLASKGSS